MSFTNTKIQPLAFTTVATLILSSFPNVCHASPISHLYKRKLATGARAGMGIGIAVVAILLLCIVVFFVVHFRRSRHLAALNRERAILAGEKNKDGSDKHDKYAPEPTVSTIPRRNKSVKDRLMGPLYRGSTIDLMPMPRAHHPGFNPNRASQAPSDDAQSFLHKPWANESSPRPSFSSKRATRMMMMM